MILALRWRSRFRSTQGRHCTTEKSLYYNVLYNSNSTLLLGYKAPIYAAKQLLRFFHFLSLGLRLQPCSASNVEIVEAPEVAKSKAECTYACIEDDP